MRAEQTISQIVLYVTLVARGVFHVAANPPEGGRWAPRRTDCRSPAERSATNLCADICAPISSHQHRHTNECVVQLRRFGFTVAHCLTSDTKQWAQKAFWEMGKRDGRTILMMRPAHPIYYI